MSSCLAALLLVLSYQEVQSTLTCPDTAKGPLTKIGNCTYFQAMGMGVVRCSALHTPAIQEFPNVTDLIVGQQVYNDSSLITFCVGVNQLLKDDLYQRSGYYLQQVVIFDNTVPLGTMVVDRQCWERRKSNMCLRDVSLLDEVLELGVFRSRPDYEEFWNFQSPLYGTQLGWLQMLFVSAKYDGISFITCKWLESMQNTSLQKVTITNNGWKDAEPFLLKDMANLEDLDLSRNHIEAFNNDSFTGVPKLENLDLSNNRLDGIPTIIERLLKLKTLDVSSNNRKQFTIPRKELSKLQLIEILGLSNNNLTSITGKLPYLPNLKRLFLDGCQLSSLEEDAFRNSPVLEYLFLSNNFMAKLEDKTFHSLRNLQTLDLSNNSLVDWPILYSCSLDILDLSINYLFSLKNLGHTGTTVGSLDISNNNISDWKDANVFSYNNASTNAKLIQVLQAQSKFRTQNNDSRHLSLSYFLAKTSSTSYLNQQKNLPYHTSEIYRSPKYGSRTWKSSYKYLDVSNYFLNKTFSKISQNIPLSKLDQVLRPKEYPIHQDVGQSTGSFNNDPSGNTFVSSSFTANNIPWVNSINISNNFIICLSEVMGKSLNEVESIDLGGNPFDCSDCQMPQFQKWLNSTKTRVDNLDTSDPVKCISPFVQQNVPVLEVDFDEEPCLDKRQSLWIILGIPLGAIFTALFAMSTVVFHFRSQITYMMHLYGIRKRAMDFSSAKYGNHAFDAFVCYSSKNRRFVLKRLAPFLETAPERYRLCLHERDFPLGSRIVENIVGSIEHSRKTIMVLSKHFVESKWCKWELEMANHKMFNDDEHFLILVQLEELNREKLPRHLKFFMDTRTFLEWPEEGKVEEEKNMQKRLKRALGESIFQRTSEEAPLLCDIMEDY